MGLGRQIGTYMGAYVAALLAGFALLAALALLAAPDRSDPDRSGCLAIPGTVCHANLADLDARLDAIYLSRPGSIRH